MSDPLALQQHAAMIVWGGTERLQFLECPSMVILARLFNHPLIRRGLSASYVCNLPYTDIGVEKLGSLCGCQGPENATPGVSEQIDALSLEAAAEPSRQFKGIREELVEAH